MYEIIRLSSIFSEMIKRLIYKALRVHLKLGLFFFFRKVMVSGMDNIPKNGPVVFVANHQNAILDGVLIASATHRTCNFLTHADIFVKPIFNLAFLHLKITFC